MKGPRRRPTHKTRGPRRARPAAGKRRSTRAPRQSATTRRAPAVDVQEIESLRADLERAAAGPARWNANAEDVRRSVIKLVLTLVELIRQLLERQAIRRMEADTLTPAETEAIGVALMRLEETVRELAARFDLTPDDLNLDLGPAGKLL